MATKYGKATFGDAKKVMRTLNKINENEGYLTYKSLGNLKDVKGQLYCDSSYGKMGGYHSAIGTASFLVGNKNSATLVDWSSKSSMCLSILL